MKRDRLFELIHEIGQGKRQEYYVLSKVADVVDCSKVFAHRWLSHFVLKGVVSMVAVKYRNTTMHYYCAPHNCGWLRRHLVDVLGKELVGYVHRSQVYES